MRRNDRHTIHSRRSRFGRRKVLPSAETLTIATVDNGAIFRMQKLADDFTTKNSGIELRWVTLKKNALRQEVTTDIAAKGGQYDVMTVGAYDVPIMVEAKLARRPGQP